MHIYIYYSMYICLNMPSALSPWWVGPAELQITSHAHTQTHTQTWAQTLYQLVFVFNTSL